MQTSQTQGPVNAKDMPVEFFLPPQTDELLWRETAKILLGCLAFIVILATLATLTNGVTIHV